MLKNKIWSLIIIVIISLTGCSSNMSGTNSITSQGTWVVLSEMNDFPEGYSDLPIGFINTNTLKNVFLELGVPEDHIKVYHDQMSREDVKNGMEWLKENAKENDKVFFYIGTHGYYLRHELDFNGELTETWKSVAVKDKVLMVDSCSSGEFIEQLEDEPYGQAFAVTSKDQVGWWGLEEEGLPIIGSIWVHYFAEAMNSDSDADDNGDGLLTLGEALDYSVVKMQDYTVGVVYRNPEFAKTALKYGYDGKEDSRYPNSVWFMNNEEDIVLKKISK